MGNAELTNSLQRVPDLPDPRLDWPGWGWWLGLVGVIGSLLLIIWPEIPLLSWGCRIGLLALLVIVAPCLLVFGRHAYRCARVAVARAKEYPAIAESLEDSIEERERAYSLISQLRLVLTSRDVFDLAYCFLSNGQAFLAVRIEKHDELGQGAMLKVVAETGQLLGTFAVVKVETEYYIARAQGQVDPLWMGYMKQTGAAHSEPPVGAVAVRIMETGDRDEP